MTMFPQSEIDFPANGASSHEPDTTGVMPGLNASLLNLLANFSPGDVGITGVEEKIRIAMSVPGWCEWASYEQVTLTVPIGSSDNVLIYQVPQDERAYLDSIAIVESSGDNLLIRLRATQPSGYGDGDRSIDFLRLTAGAQNIFWPDPGGHLSVLTINNHSPLWLEPGAVLEISPTGAGVAETIYVARLAMRHTKMVLSIVP